MARGTFSASLSLSHPAAAPEAMAPPQNHAQVIIMKSRRSVIRAILFVLRLQKNVIITRNESRRNTLANTSNKLIRCESTRHRRRSSHKTTQRHRNSAPSSSFPLRSPSVLRPFTTTPQAEKLVDFAAFSGMSQPYSIGLDESRGRPLLSVCAGAAHTLASTALLCRQASLDEPATRALEKVASGPLLKYQRQGSVETLERKKRSTDENDNKLQRKAVKSNMISMFGALLAVEQEDDAALRLVLCKNQIDINATLTSGQYAEHSTRWTLLDVALNLRCLSCTNILIQHGAVENISMNTFDKRKNALNGALQQTRDKLEELKNSSHSKENEKSIRALSAHQNILEKMERLIAIEEIPAEPVNVKVEATSATEVAVFVSPNYFSAEVIIKYKIEWSVYPNFETIYAEHIETDTQLDPIVIKGLEPGMRFAFRVSAAGIHGWSPPTECTPAMVEISSWMEVEGKREGWKEHVNAIDLLTDEIERHRQSLVWQRVYPSIDMSFKKKKASLKELFSASLKFSKNASRGVYLASIVYTEGKVLCTVDDCLPILPIDESVTTLSKDDHHWLMKMSLCWEQVGSLIDSSPNAYANNVSLSFRLKLISAATMMHSALGVRDIGHLYHIPIVHENCIFLVTVKFLDQAQLVTGLTMRWISFDKLLRKRMASAAVDLLTKETVSIMNFFESSQIPLKRGLYLCYMKLHSTMNTIRVVVPDNLPSMLPFVHVRDNPHVTKEEWKWVKSTDVNEEFAPSAAQLTLHGQLSTAIQTLLHDLDIDADLVPGHRLYHAEILQPSTNVSIILILPRPEEVCSAPTGSVIQTETSENRRGCSSIPIPVFEMIHQCTYQPEFITMYCRLSIFLEHYTMISHYEQRKCLLENDCKVYKQQIETLTEFQKKLDEVWKNARWISRIASEARDKHVRVSKNAVPLGRLMAPLISPSGEESNDVGYHSDQGEHAHLLRVAKPPCLSRPHSVMGSPQESYRDIDRFYRRRKLSADHRRCSSTEVPGQTDRPPLREEDTVTGVVTVYSAIDCGLPKGTSVKLSIAGCTTSQEVVYLVLEQLAKSSAAMSGSDIVVPEQDDHCLAAVIGARERRLKDDFALLRLQNPWTKGKLFIRRRDDFLAAVQVGNEAVV